MSVGPEDNNKCAASIKRISMKAYQGDALHLICDSLPTLWKFNDEIIQSSTQKVFTMAGGMVLFNVSLFFKYSDEILQIMNVVIHFTLNLKKLY